METAILATDYSELATVSAQRIDKNPAAVFLASKKSNSRRVYLNDLAAMAELLTGAPDPLGCQWAALRYEHTQAIRARLTETVSNATGKPLAPATVNRMLCALRGVLKAAWLLGQMPAEDYHRAIQVNSIIGETIPAGRGLAGGEIAAIMAACENDPTPAGARDAALFGLAYAAGLRRAELCSLDLGDYDPDSGRLVILGKRNKQRTAYLTNGAKRAMADWLAIRGSEPGPLFIPINKGGKLTPHRMTPQAIYNLMAKRGADAGVKEFSPHDLRRSFVSDLLDAGADIATVAKMAGHASVTTTARYDRRPEQAKEKAAGLLHVPYRGRLIS